MIRWFSCEQNEFYDSLNAVYCSSINDFVLVFSFFVFSFSIGWFVWLLVSIAGTNANANANTKVQEDKHVSIVQAIQLI